MSNTKIQKEQIKLINELIDEPTEKLRKKMDRHSSDAGKYRNERNKLRLKSIQLIDKI